MASRKASAAKWGSGLIATLGFASLSACATPSNQGACLDYYEALQDLSCVSGGDYSNTDERCPPSLNDDPCDYVTFYECREDTAQCTGSALDTTGNERCKLNC